MWGHNISKNVHIKTYHRQLRVCVCTLCLASSISQVCRSMLIGWEACSRSAVWESQACNSSRVFWNWPKPSSAHSNWCCSKTQESCWSTIMMKQYIYTFIFYFFHLAEILPVCWQSLTPDCPIADGSHTVERWTQAAQCPGRDDTQSDGLDFQSRSSSDRALAYIPERRGDGITTNLFVTQFSVSQSKFVWYTFRSHSCSLTDPRSDPTEKSSVDFSSADFSHSKSPYKRRSYF